MQEVLLKRLKGIASFFPRKYLQSPRYRLIKAKLEKEYQKLLEASPGIQKRLSSLQEEEPSAPVTP